MSRELFGDGTTDRRHWSRIRLSVPVRVGKASGGAMSYETAQAVDLSAGGAYVTVHSPRMGFAPGEILSLSVAVPSESRQAFPFSRLAGSCRVVRVDERWTPGGHIRGLALAFCGNEVTMLGAIV